MKLVNKIFIGSILLLLPILMSCSKNNNNLQMNYNNLNKTITKNINLTKGNDLKILIKNTKGAVTVNVSDTNQKIIFTQDYNKEEGNYVFSVPETGEYTIGITGINASGSLSCQN